MSREADAHLTEQALLRWQMGDASKTERAHVNGCLHCQAQAKPMTDALGWFGAAARQWGDEKAAVTREWRESKAAASQERGDATRSAVSEWHGAKAAAAQSWRAMAASWAVACIVLLLIFGIGLPRWKAHRRALEAQAKQQQLQQELARDNALLDEVDRDVSQVVPEAMQPLSRESAGTSAAGKASSRPTQQ